MRRALSTSLCFAISLCLANWASAGPEASVRVRGSTRLHAMAAAANSGFVLQGTLLEDAGRAVAGARIRVRWLSNDGSSRLLPQPETCGTRPADSLRDPYRGGEQVFAVTDALGRFCLRWPLELPEGQLTVTFDDDRLLLDAAEQTLQIEQRPPIELEFAPPPRTFSLDASEITVLLASRTRSTEVSDTLPLRLTWTRAGSPTTSLIERELRPGEAANLRFSSRELGGPGPGELRAELGSTDRAVEARAQVIATATVRLNSAEELTLSAGGEGFLSVEVDSAAGPVGSGSVEALLADRTVGIAAVSSGRARLPLSLGPGPFTRPVLIRYLPAGPWWLAGRAHEVSITVPRPSAWRGIAWAAALVAIATWLVAAWRRPPHRERARKESAAQKAPPEAAVQWVGVAAGARGWTGIVSDAHDGTPLSNVSISIDFAHGERRIASSETDGSFHLDAPEGEEHSGRLQAEGAWHSPLDWPLPPRGRIAVTLITRRRTLLARLIEWAIHRGAPWNTAGDPTPGELARKAEGSGQPDVADWARAVEASAFGPEAVDANAEARVRSLEPDSKA